MENYKIINSELIAQVQEMRVTIASYQKELVLLRAQLMEQQTQRVEMKYKCCEMLTRNFMHTMQEINPDSCILQLLNNADVSNISASKSAVNSKRSIDKSRERFSNSLIQELRSSSTLQRQYNQVPVSPTRRRSSASELYTSTRSSLNLSKSLSKRTSVTCDTDEDDDDDDDEEERDYNDQAEDEYDNAMQKESVEKNEQDELVQTMASIRMTFDTIEEMDNENSAENLNSTANFETNNTMSNPYTKDDTISSPISMDEESLSSSSESSYSPEQVIHVVTRRGKQQTTHEKNIRAGRINHSLRNDYDQLSDVDNHEDNKRNEINNQDIVNNSSTRPRRRCAPTNLMEQPIRIKLRNELPSTRMRARKK